MVVSLGVPIFRVFTVVMALLNLLVHIKSSVLINFSLSK